MPGPPDHPVAYTRCVSMQRLASALSMSARVKAKLASLASKD